MNISPANSARRKPSALRVILFIGGGFLAAAVVAIGAFWIFSERTSSDLAEQEKKCCWKSGATPAWMSEQIGVRIPEDASDRRAGYKTGSRYDTGLIAFTLPSEEADAYLSPLNPEGTEMIRNFHPKEKGYRPAAPFAHLDLPEPETLVKGMRLGGFCPGDVASANGKDVKYCVDLFAHEFKPDSTRIYVRSTIEPGLTPPPAPSGK